MQSNKQIRLFNMYNFSVLPKFRYHIDGPDDDGSMFITDPKETFIVSFEKGMQMIDMLDVKSTGAQSVSFQWCNGGKYIHQRRGNSSSDRCAFFHIELEDNDGKIFCLTGQMVVSADYKWTDGIEPILIKLVDSITLI